MNSESVSTGKADRLVSLSIAEARGFLREGKEMKGIVPECNHQSIQHFFVSHSHEWAWTASMGNSRGSLTNPTVAEEGSGRHPARKQLVEGEPEPIEVRLFVT